MHQRIGAAFVTVNSCVWPLVFATFGLITGNGPRLAAFVAGGALFGGTVFLIQACVQTVVRSCFANSRLDRHFLESMPRSRTLIGGGLILIGWGTVGLISEFVTMNGSLSGESK